MQNEAGGATSSDYAKPSHVTVSIHAPAGGATPSLFALLVSKLFQSTRLREARLLPSRKAWRLSGFNPRACGRRDTNYLSEIVETPVSIHAPAGGATLPHADLRHTLLVSIHAPAGGATKAMRKQLMNYPFQSTRLREARLVTAMICAHNAMFQSTRLREARQDCQCMYLKFLQFQSTRLREARQQAITATISLPCFNPRACGRRDAS